MTTPQDRKPPASDRDTLAQSGLTRDTGHGAHWAQQWIADEIEKAKK